MPDKRITLRLGLRSAIVVVAPVYIPLCPLKAHGSCEKQEVGLEAAAAGVDRLILRSRETRKPSVGKTKKYKKLHF